MKLKINKTLLANLDKHRPAKGKAYLRDSGLTGFAIALSPTAASYICEKRCPMTSKTKRIALGKVEYLDLDEARLKAKEILLSLEKGESIDDKNRRRRTVPTFEEALDLYLDQRPLRKNTSDQYRRDITKNLADWLKMPISKVTEEMAIRSFKEIEKRAPGVASKVMVIAHAVLSFASAHPTCRHPDGSRMLAISPVRILSELRIRTQFKPRTDHINTEDMPRFYEGLQSITCPTTRNLILFILLTGCRKSEARLLKWHEVNMLSRRVSLPAERVKTNQARLIPITDELAEILQDQASRRLPVGDYVFPTKSGIAPLSNLRIGELLKQAAKSMSDQYITPHGLRRTYITHTSKADVMPEYIQKKLVGHSHDVTADYRQIAFADLLEAAQRATKHIQYLLQGESHIPARKGMAGR